MTVGLVTQTVTPWLSGGARLQWGRAGQRDGRILGCRLTSHSDGERRALVSGPLVTVGLDSAHNEVRVFIFS